MRITGPQARALAAGMRPPRSEAELQSAILAFLKTVPGVYAFRANSRVVRMPGRGGRERLVRFGVKGLPDILGWQSFRDPWRGPFGWPVPRFIAIEVKAPGREPTPEQAAFLELLRSAGGIGLVARSVEDVVEAFGRAGQHA